MKFETPSMVGETVLAGEPFFPRGGQYLAVVYGFQEQDGKAAATVEQIREKFPAFGIKNVILLSTTRSGTSLTGSSTSFGPRGCPKDNRLTWKGQHHSWC
jgi:hypothetical protein